VPLFDSLGKKEKFSIQELVQFKSITVEELIYQSLLEYVDRQTFNSKKDVLKWFTKFKISASEISEYLASIDELIQRRHRIVHNADIITDRLKLNLNKASIHDGEIKPLEDISKSFVEEKLNIMFPFVFKAVKVFLPSGAEIIMQNV
jgi:flagellar biosynthesis/type III secretory pathway chaperone